MTLIEARDLVKSYSETAERLDVIKELNLKIEEGEMLAVTGESGSGKSTLLHLLGLLDSWDSGTIFYQGKEISVTDREIHLFRNRTIGFVFQFHYLLKDFTAEENVAMPMFIATRNYRKSLQKARILLNNLDLGDRCDHYPNQLSGGEQQRVAVARALINDPKIVLADEPTGNLDHKHSLELIDLLMGLNKTKGHTFVIATHDLETADQLDRHLILRDGILHPS